MKMYIPEIGDIITLKEDWEFVVHDESRNKSLIKAMAIDFTYDVEVSGNGNILNASANINVFDYQYYVKFLIENIDSDYNIIGSATSLISTITHERINYNSPLKYNFYDIKITNSKQGINKKISRTETFAFQNVGDSPTFTIKVDVDINYQTCTLPKGTQLKIDRIYIRKGNEDYSSITFYIEDCPDKTFRPKKKIRFWSKLDDVNNIIFE